MEDFDPEIIQNIDSQNRIKQAMEYKRNIASLVSKQSTEVKAKLSQALADMDRWLLLMFRLAQDIDSFETSPRINRDMRILPIELESLKNQLISESDPAKQAQLRQAITNREDLLGKLQVLIENVRQSHIRLTELLQKFKEVHRLMESLDRSMRNRDSSI